MYIQPRKGVFVSGSRSHRFLAVAGLLFAALPPAAQSGAVPQRSGLDTITSSPSAYAIELQVSGNPVQVREDRKFRSGDLFRFVFRPEFDAHVYMVARWPRQANYTVLYPGERASAPNPIPAGEKVTVPNADIGWLHMDNEKGDENLLLIAATSPLAEFAGMATTVEREAFESRLAEVERQHHPASYRRFEDGDWVKLFAAKGKESLAIVLRIPLLHQ
jgi:hypothetical protein